MRAPIHVFALVTLALTASCESTEPSTYGRLDQVLENAYRPSAPTLTSLTPGNGEITAQFQAASGGIHTIIEYAVGCTPVPGDSTMTKTKVAPSAPITVTGLANGTLYSCYARSRSAGGVSEKSGSLTATPSAP